MGCCWSPITPQSTPVRTPCAPAVLYALYGVAGLALVVRWPRPIWATAGAALLAAAPFWALWQHPATHHVGPLWAALLGGESLLMAAVAAGLTRLSAPAEPTKRRRRGPLPVRFPGLALVRAAPLAELYRNALACVAEWSAGLGVPAAAAIAWRDRDAIFHAPAMPTAAACLAAAWFLLAWLRRSPARTWIGSTVVVAGLLHTLGSNYPDLVDQPWLTAWLIHGTAAITAAMALELWTFRRRQPLPTASWLRVFSRPLFDAALCSSTFAVLTALVNPPAGPMPLAARLFWLSAIWLALAWRKRDALLVAAHQATLTAATLAAVAAWLERVGWIESLHSPSLIEPHCLQAFGIGLAILSLAWAAARIGVRLTAIGRGLWDGRQTLDRTVRCGVAVAQWVLLADIVLPAAVRQLDPRTLSLMPLSEQSALGRDPLDPGRSRRLDRGAGPVGPLRAERLDRRIVRRGGGSMPDRRPISGSACRRHGIRFALAAAFLVAIAVVCLRQRLFAASGRGARSTSVLPAPCWPAAGRC